MKTKNELWKKVEPQQAIVIIFKKPKRRKKKRKSCQCPLHTILTCQGERETDTLKKEVYNCVSRVALYYHQQTYLCALETMICDRISTTQ